MTRNCVNGSSSGPPQTRGIAIPNTPASFIARAMPGGIRRPRSISSPAVRICSANPIAACRIGESSAVALPAAREGLIGSACSGVTIACRWEYLESMLFSSWRLSGSVAGPERFREFATHSLSPEADVLEQVITELAQLLARMGAGTASPTPNGGHDPPDRRERRDTPGLGARRHPLCKPQFRW